MRLKFFRSPLLLGVVGLIFLFSGCASLQKAKELKREGKEREALAMAEEFLADDDPKVRIQAVKLIGSIDNPRSGELLEPILDDLESSVKNVAIKNIAFLNYTPAGDKLVSMVSRAKGETFDELAAAFRKMGPPTTDILIRKFDAPSNDNRALFVSMFKAIGPKIADSLATSLEGRTAFENRAKFDILVALRSPRVSGILVGYVDDEGVGELVVEGLTKLGSMSALPAITELRRRMGKVEKQAGKERLIRVLGRIKDKRAIEILEKLTQDSSDQIRSAAEHSLLQIRGF